MPFSAHGGGEPLCLLENDAPELAVARGAVAYGLARRGIGVRIGGGSARSYFFVLPTQDDEGRRGVCVLPRGAEEGEEIVLDRSFSLRLGQPVRFPLVATTADVRHVRAGDIVAIDEDVYRDLPPIAAVLEDATGASREVPVRLVTSLTEVGTLEMSCILVEDGRTTDRRWKLEFQARGDANRDAEVSTTRVAVLHPRFRDATERVHLVYGKSAQDVTHREVKTLRADLEKIIGARDTWDTPLLRELFGALFAGVKRRRRSADHERVWFNLVGYSLRPGFGYPLDDWRAKQLVSILDQGVQFAPEAQNWSEWWTLFRRVAGGLDPNAQARVMNELEWYLEPPSPRPKKRPVGPKKLGYDDMVRLAGSLERIASDRKERVGSWLLERLTKHDENPQSWWAVGRIGARVPFYGSAHEVVPIDSAAAWLEACLARDWNREPQAAFAATLLSRVSGDRQRDLPEAMRERVASRLERTTSPPSWVQMVREPTHLEAADARRIFGESLPPGLRLLD